MSRFKLTEQELLEHAKKCSELREFVRQKALQTFGNNASFDLKEDKELAAIA